MGLQANEGVRRTLAMARTGALTGALAVASMGWGTAQPVAAQGKDLSDQSIGTLIDYAWAITPPKFTLPSGKTIEVDKNNRDSAMVPIETARVVVRVGRLSANAQICGLKEEQGANYQTLMAREQDKKKWSDQQLLFISQLHLFTVMMLTGKVNVVAREGEDKAVSVEEQAKAAAAEAAKPPVTCSDTEREKVRQQIETYINAEAPAAEAKKQ